PGGLGVDEEYGHAVGFFWNLIDWRSSCEEDHQLGMLQPRSPDLLAVHHVAVALPDRDGLDPGGIGTGAGLGDAHRLQAQLADGDLRQVFLFLAFRAVAQQRVHVVHLAVAATGIAARARHLFHDHARLGEREARAAVFLWNERRHPAGLGESVDERLGVDALVVDALPVDRVVLAAKRAHRVAQLRVVVAAEVHFFGLRWADASSSMRSQISSAIGERDSSSRCPTSPTARAITPSPRHTFQSKPSSHASAPIAPVAFSVMLLSFATSSISLQYLP